MQKMHDGFTFHADCFGPTLLSWRGHRCLKKSVNPFVLLPLCKQNGVIRLCLEAARTLSFCKGRFTRWMNWNIRLVAITFLFCFGHLHIYLVSFLRLASLTEERSAGALPKQFEVFFRIGTPQTESIDRCFMKWKDSYFFEKNQQGKNK